MSAASSAACPTKPAPHSTPTAAEHHTVAAVLSPRTPKPSLKITPAPRKPTPVTTCAATRVGLPSPGSNCEKATKPAAPSATKALVCMPARRWRHWRSMPMRAPSSSAARSCAAKAATPQKPQISGTRKTATTKYQHMIGRPSFQ